MTKFEYKTHVIKLSHNMFSSEIDADEVEKIMNDLGQLGWELMGNLNNISNNGTNQVILIFKRAI